MSIEDAVGKIVDIHATKFIFVYSPPKVGSTTLVSSLRISLGRSYNICHIHDEIMLNVLTNINNIKINDIIRYLAEHGKIVYVIDVYRTPIERKMSEFFEKLAPYHFNNTEDNISKYDIHRIITRFNKVFPHIENGDHYHEKYDIPNPKHFDYVKKYTIETYNNIHYIKLRLCDSHSWASILTEILQTDIVLVSDYKTASKPIGDLYAKFKIAYRLPINYFDIVSTDKYLNLYYNHEEKNIYLAKWKQQLTDIISIPYTTDEYSFYINLCMENQHIPDLQIEHYIDNCCWCNCCTKKRRDIFIRAKKGETEFNKIIHHNLIKIHRKQKIQHFYSALLSSTVIKDDKFKIKLY